MTNEFLVRPDSSWKCPACLNAPTKKLCDDCKYAYANDICWLQCSKAFEYRGHIRIAIASLLVSIFGFLLSTSMWTAGPHLQAISSTLSAYLPSMLAVLFADNTTRAWFNIILIILCCILTAVITGSFMVLLFVTTVDPRRPIWKGSSATGYMSIGFLMLQTGLFSVPFDALFVRLPLSLSVGGFCWSAALKRESFLENKKNNFSKDLEQGRRVE